MSSNEAISVLLTAAGFPCPDEVELAAIEQHGSQFIRAMLGANGCIAKENVGAVELLLSCISSSTSETARSLGFAPTFERLVWLGIHQPKRFLSAIRVAKDMEHQRSAEAKQYLARVLQGRKVADVGTAEALPRTTLDDRSYPSTDSVARIARSHVVVPVSFAESDSRPVVPPTSIKYESEHVYGGQFALTFNASERYGWHGIMVDGAVARGPKDYDWRNAVHLLLNPAEVGGVLSVLYRRKKELHCDFHGSKSDKSFFIEDQGEHFFAGVTARGKGKRSVSIEITQAVPIVMLLGRQFARNYPDLSVNEAIEMALSVQQQRAA